MEEESWDIPRLKGLKENGRAAISPSGSWSLSRRLGSPGDTSVSNGTRSRFATRLRLSISH